jgi:NitT/TauT family transport system ATP-binding protein
MVDLEFQDISHRFSKEQAVIEGLNVTIQKGEFVSLVGRSGCGKTTLLRMAAGLLRPDRGMVRIAEQPVTKPQSQVGVVFQAPTLLEWKTVEENVLLPISLIRKPAGSDKQAARDYLERMGLTEFIHRYPGELSGGQQSRVAIARALIREPSILLMDEPFAALDALTREALQDDLLGLCRNKQITVLFITHDITEAVYLSNRVIVLHGGGISGEFTVPLPEQRSYTMRYTTDFNQVCLAVRQCMEEGGQRH